MSESMFMDKNSRYNNLDNENIVFLTPNQINEFDIGLDLSMFSPKEYDDLFPFVVDSLKEMVKETTLGEQNGSEISYDVENSDCKVYLCIEVNGKLCKVQSEEFSKGFVPLFNQTKLFQRLLSEGQVTLDDVAAEDIDNDVYKRLVVNDINGAQLCKRKLIQIDKWVEEQSKNDLMKKRKENVLRSL